MMQWYQLYAQWLRRSFFLFFNLTKTVLGWIFGTLVCCYLLHSQFYVLCTLSMLVLFPLKLWRWLLLYLSYTWSLLRHTNFWHGWRLFGFVRGITKLNHRSPIDSHTLKNMDVVKSICFFLNPHKILRRHILHVETVSRTMAPFHNCLAMHFCAACMSYKKELSLDTFINNHTGQFINNALHYSVKIKLIFYNLYARQVQ